MATDNKRKLYDALSQDYDMGSYEQFCADLNDESKRRKLYNATSQEYDLGSWDSFSQQLGYGQAAAPERPAVAAQPSAPAPAPTKYFKLRRGGKDFTVATDEVNAAGGLYDWSKAHPGAPLRVYMQGTDANGKPFDGHVNLSVAHDRSKKRGYKYTTTDKPIETTPQKPWKPTKMQQRAMSMQLQQLQQQRDAFIEQSRERMQNMSDYYRSNRSLGFQTVEGEPVFNPETGKMEKTYLTPTGDRTTSKAVADMETMNYRSAMAAADMSVGAQIRRAEAELADLKKKLESSASRVHDEWAEDYENNSAPLAAVLAANTYVPRQQVDKENSALRVAIRQKEEQLKDLYEERDRQVGKDVGFWRGFGRTMSDYRTWDFGMSDLQDAMTMMHADQYSTSDATEGEKRAGQEMLKAIHDNQQVEQMYGGNASFWNRAGVMTGYMPSFMLDFALTSGGYEAINVGGKIATRGAVKVLGKEAIKEMTELGVKAYAKKYGVRGVGRMAENWTIKALGTTADDLLIRAPLMTNTIQAGKTTADIIERKLGDVVVDENGNYDFSNDKTWGSAVWQGEANAIIENYSEMFGAHLDGVMPALAKTFGGKRISGMLARANASSYGQILATTRKQFERLGVSDYFGEVSEEYYGQLWRSMLNLDDAYTNVPVLDQDGNQVLDADGNPVYERKNLLFTGQFHGDIWGGMALSMGLMGAGKYTLSGAAYGAMKHQVNKADRTAAEIFTPDRWEPIRELIDNTTNEDIGVLAENMVNDQNLSDDERSAVMEYMERSLNLRGLNLGAMSQSRGTVDVEADGVPEIDSELSQSYIDGYEASTPQEMNDAQNMYELQHQRVEGIFEPSILEWLDANPVNALMEMSRNGLYSQEEIDAALDYTNAKTLRDGIIQRVNDNIDEQIAQSDAMINARVNSASGMIQPAIMDLDDRQVYIVGGAVAINPDGTIDREASDESIVVRDAQTGELQFTEPKSIVSAGEAIDPELERATAVDNIRQQAAQAAANAMNGVLPLNPGDVVPIIAGGSPTTFTIIGPALDEQTQSPIPDKFVVEWENGIQTSLTREQIQSYADEEAIARLNNFEQERAATRAQQRAVEAEAVRPRFALNDEFTILNDSGTPIRGSITGELDEDGTVEIFTEEPINGNKVNRFTPAELEGMFDSYNGQPLRMPEPFVEPVVETGNNDVENIPENIPENGNIIDENIPTDAEATEPQQSALSRVPIDEQGQPKYEEADPDTAWDAIVEQAQGDEATAAEVVADIVSEREEDFNAAEKALNKTKEGKPEKRKKNDPAPTMAERIAAKNAAKDALTEAQAIRDRAKAILDHWKKIAGTKQRREAERRSAEDAEARRRAEERAAEEARLRAEREEAERIEREALNGVPDWNVDTPTDARARGYRRNGPQKVDRPAVIDNHAQGNAVEVKFGEDVMPKGHIAIIEASQLQPSHRDGQRNPAHFLDEAQPKERKDAASRLAASKIAENIRPEEITSSVTAYTGAPSINSRGEVIQGNNRSEALRLMYEGNNAASAERYKQYLLDHAAEYGLTPEAISAFEQPVLVNMLDVSDEDAITLGQYVAQDTESGGIERIKPKNAVKKMGDKIRTFANLLLRSADDEATFSQLVDANGVEVLKWMNQQGFITNTQYASAFDSKGNLSAEAVNDLKGIMYQSIFTGGSTRLEEMFNKLPAKAQRAILATAFRDYDSAFADRMITEIQQSIIAFNALMGDQQFREAGNMETVMHAVEAWKRQTAFDDVTGEPYLPSESFSNFTLALAAMYKGCTQKHIQSVFNTMYDIVQGTEQDNLFEVADKTPKPLAEAIRRVLNIEYKPITKPTTDNGTNGSAILDVDSEDGQDGRPGSDGNSDGAEQNPQGAEPADGGTGAASNSGQGSEVATFDPREMSDEERTQRGDLLRNAEAVNVATGVITAQEGKSARKVAEEWWDKNVGEPVIFDTEAGEVEIDKNSIKDSLAHGYRQEKLDAVTSLAEGFRNAVYLGRIEDFNRHGVMSHYFAYPINYDGQRRYVFCRAMADNNKNRLYVHEVFMADSIKKSDTLQTIASASKDGELHGGIALYKAILKNVLDVSEETPKSIDKTTNTDDNPTDLQGDTALLQNSGVSDDKDSALSEEKQADTPKSSLADRVSAAEKDVNTNPTQAQKEAGNYKKGHVQVGTFDVTIEQPVGSVRRGTDADGKEWETTMHNTYGYIRGTEGVDGDHIDVFLSDNIDGWNGQRVVIVDQYNPDGSFDEHKVMLGFNDKADAINAYLANYEKGWEKGRRLVFTTATIDDFEKWIESSHRKKKPYHEYKIAEKAEVEESTPEKPIETQKPIGYDAATDTWSNVPGKWFTSKPNRYGVVIARGGENTGRIELFANNRYVFARVWIYDENAETPDAILSILSKEHYDIQSNGEGTFVDFEHYSDAEAFAKRVDEVQEQAQTARENRRKEKEAEENAHEKPVSSEGSDYTIDTYTSKSKKTFHRVVFPRVDKDVWQERLNLAKKMGGTSVPKGYGFKTREEAEAFAKAVADPAAVSDAQPLSLEDMRHSSGVAQVDVESLMTQLSETGEANLADHSTPVEATPDNKGEEKPEEKPVNPSGNKLVTDERYAELRERMRKKLGGQLNMGVDPEILAIGTEMAVYHIEKGARKFKEYASAMIADLGDAIRPYLKSFYNAVRDMPEAETAGLVDDMDSYEDVRSVDIANFDKSGKDAMATAAAVVAEQQAEKERQEAEAKLKDERKKRVNPDGSTTETVRDALAERGVKIGKPEKGNAGKASMPAFEQWIAEQERQRMGDGYGAYSDAEVSFANDPVLKALGKNRFSKKRQAEFAARERQRMADRIQELAERMHLGNVEILTDASGLEGKRANAKGFYNKRTGKITIVIPNNVSTIDAEQTLLHEAVAHYGLRQLFGEQFNTFLDNVYDAADESIRRKIAEMAAKNGWDFRTATEEYLAGLAEDTNFDEALSYKGWWSKIKRMFLNMLDKIGFEGFRDKTGVVLTDNELRYILWRSYENLAEPGRYRSILGEAADVAKQAELKVGNYAEKGIEAEYAAESGDLYRPGDFSPRDQVIARRYYESVVRSGSYQFKEAVQDSMLGLKALYQAVLGKGKRIEDVAGFENAYLFENRMSSMNAGEQHEYFQRYMQPLLKEIGRIAGADKRKRRELTDYLMAKHGLERNEYMRNEATTNGEDSDRDFAGLIGLTGEADWQAAEATAQQWVDDYEAAHNTAPLWDAINKATKATLEKVYLSGIISKETYEKILGMYEYYIPLRGWNETTSDEVYGYLTSKDGPLGGSIMKKAEGRESMADDPIATIAMMADDAVRQGNRNLMKQRFLNFILNHPSDAVSVHDIWLQYNTVTDEWEPVFADVEETDTADEVAQKVEAFEQRMEALRNAEPDKYKRGREAQHIPYKVVRGNMREHQILIKRNGRTFVATINGNPRAAQALNGLTNPDVDINGVVGNMLKACTWINRQLSAFYTTRNPDFVVGNFFRDMLYSNCMTWVKESPRYALRFHKNFARVNPIVMRRLLGKWEKGTLNTNNHIESLFYQFMKNGGETGYTNVRDIDGHKRAIAAELKKQGSRGRRVWTALGMMLDLLNRSAENCARFAAFMTSREFGRNIDRAIYDAKEISVNFNKKGSGGKMVNATGQTKLGKAGAYLSGGGRLAYVFWNAGVQGMTNFGRQAKLHPGKATAGATALFALGYVIPMLAQMLGGGDGDDDDKNAYYNLPEYVRRSNICFYAGEQWVTIPLPIEFRAIYGMGELAYGVISGNEQYSNEELTRQMAAQVSQMMPLDMLEGGGGISPFIPSAFKPVSEAYIMNKGWTGLPVYKDTPFNKNDPEWTKAYASADKHLVAFAKWLNETSGGDDFKKGSIDINPAKIEYLLSGTFGGVFTFLNKVKKTGETMFGDRDFEWRNMPIANRLIKSGDERTANRKLQNEYFKYLKEYEATGQLMRKYESADEDGIMGYAEKINFLENSPEYARWEIFDEFKADIDAYREEIAAETDKDEKKRIEAEMYAVMRELVNALHDPEAYRNREQE